MAANYATGISSSPTDLLQKLVTFLTTQGWTSDHSASEGSGWRVHMHKDGLYVNMRSAMNEKLWPQTASGYWHDYGDGGYGIGLNLGDGYDSGDDWHDQSGVPIRPAELSPVGAGANLPSGSVAAYHLFDDGADNIIVVVERRPGIFCHFGWGPAMAPSGQPEDFPYFFGSSCQALNTHDGVLLGDAHGINLSALPPVSHGDLERNSISGTMQYVHTVACVRVDAATYAAQWVSNCGTDNPGAGSTGRFMRCAVNISGEYGVYEEDEYPDFDHFEDRLHNVAYAGAAILPMPCFVLTDPDARWAPIGYAPSIYYCDAVGHGYAGGTVYQVGGQDYMVFPHFAVLKGA